LIQEILFYKAPAIHIMDQDGMHPLPQDTYAIKIVSNLIQLKSDGFSNITDDMIKEWSKRPPQPKSLPSSQALLPRLQFLWRTIEQSKISTAVTFNPLMTSCHYTYKGHDYGWFDTHKDTPRLNHTKELQKDSHHATVINSIYMKLLVLSQNLTRIREYIRNTISQVFGPMLCWIPGFQVSSDKIELHPLLHY
jgi:hypothetical protein